VGVYPCKHCGALFISVNMTQQVHAPDCPYAPCATPLCGHAKSAHGGHTHRVGTPEPSHCSQLCGCKAFLPTITGAAG
jgi:hypothetical protein